MWFSTVQIKVDWLIELLIATLVFVFWMFMFVQLLKDPLRVDSFIHPSWWGNQVLIREHGQIIAFASFSVNSNWHSTCFHDPVIEGHCAFPSVALHLPCFPRSPLQSSTCGSQSLGCASLTEELFTLYTTRPHSHHSGWVPVPMPWQRAGIFWQPSIQILLFQNVLL